MVWICKQVYLYVSPVFLASYFTLSEPYNRRIIFGTSIFLGGAGKELRCDFGEK